MTRPFISRPFKTATLILLTVLITSIVFFSCKKQTVVLYPMDPTVKTVQKLPNGNWEVTEAYVFEHSKLLAQRALLISLLKEKGVTVLEGGIK